MIFKNNKTINGGGRSKVGRWWWCKVVGGNVGGKFASVAAAAAAEEWNNGGAAEYEVFKYVAKLPIPQHVYGSVYNRIQVAEWVVPQHVRTPPNELWNHPFRNVYTDPYTRCRMGGSETKNSFKHTKFSQIHYKSYNRWYLPQMIVKCSVNRWFRIEIGTLIVARNKGEAQYTMDE